MLEMPPKYFKFLQMLSSQSLVRIKAALQVIYDLRYSPGYVYHFSSGMLLPLLPAMTLNFTFDLAKSIYKHLNERKHLLQVISTYP